MSRNFFNNFRPIARDRTRDRLVVYIGTGLNLSKKIAGFRALGHNFTLADAWHRQSSRHGEAEEFLSCGKKNGWPVPWVDYRLSYRNFATILDKIDGKFVPPFLLPPPPNQVILSKIVPLSIGKTPFPFATIPAALESPDLTTLLRLN